MVAGTILPSSWRSWGGAGSSCFSILRVDKKAAERIKHGKSDPILKPKKEANRRAMCIGGAKV